jgi:hypothetical protein
MMTKKLCSKLSILLMGISIVCLLFVSNDVNAQKRGRALWPSGISSTTSSNDQLGDSIKVKGRENRQNREGNRNSTKRREGDNYRKEMSDSLKQYREGRGHKEDKEKKDDDDKNEKSDLLNHDGHDKMEHMRDSLGNEMRSDKNRMKMKSKNIKKRH